MYRLHFFFCLFLILLSQIGIGSFFTPAYAHETKPPYRPAVLSASVPFSLFSLISSSNHPSLQIQSPLIVTNQLQIKEIDPEFEGVHIEIDIGYNRMTVFLNTKPLYSFRVATGKNKTHTPLGNYSIITKVENPWYLPKNIAGGDPRNPLGTRWLGINVPGTSGYKYGIHGTNNPYSIGGYVTQGCIRLQNKQVEWLFRHIEVGTLVIIKDSSKKK